jgi:hypothetical protein
VVGLWLFGAHEENGFAQAAPRVVQFREEHVRCGNAAVVRGRRSERDEVGRRAHLSVVRGALVGVRFCPSQVRLTKKNSFRGGKAEPNSVRDNICV